MPDAAHLTSDGFGIVRESKSENGGFFAVPSLRANRFKSQGRRHSNPPAPLTINFNPTVVIKSSPDQAGKQNIINALSRHSHELIQLIDQEIAKQRRVEF
jgi:hypothetical protein